MDKQVKRHSGVVTSYVCSQQVFKKERATKEPSAQLEVMCSILKVIGFYHKSLVLFHKQHLSSTSVHNKVCKYKLICSSKAKEALVS